MTKLGRLVNDGKIGSLEVCGGPVSVAFRLLVFLGRESRGFSFLGDHLFGNLSQKDGPPEKKQKNNKRRVWFFIFFPFLPMFFLGTPLFLSHTQRVDVKWLVQSRLLCETAPFPLWK